MNAFAKLSRVLIDPTSSTGWALNEWDAVLRLSDTALLTGSLAAQLQAASVITALPAPVQARLASAYLQCVANRRAAAWEVKRLELAFKPLGVGVVLLKGAAYAMADLPSSHGRFFGDVDILVPKKRLDDVEACLYWQGWINTHYDAYDNRYYREWMHELPPLMHQKRQNVLDVHHTILPPTARYHPDPTKLHADAVPLPEQQGVFVLAPCDMVIHSACHLFHESEWESSMRDLFDLDRLLRHFGKEPAFFDRLIARAHELELQRPLYYAVRYSMHTWQTPVPAASRAALQKAGPVMPVRLLMDALILRALRPRHPLAKRVGDRLARFCLYVRGHWLRMPVQLLIPHLLRKAIKPYLPERT
ncbi:nucleotidyltransferase domain-containing protein [Chitinimonas sp. PSY-7]|uniref:nucleotidyltransferase family protein n=1 Tax=Chitinimonas sp. PSY-7 TaxID=3459088 RepID=UPI00403FF16E